MGQNKWAMAYVKNNYILDYSVVFTDSREKARKRKNLLKPLFRNEKDFKIQIFKVEDSHNKITFIKTH